MDKKGFIAKEIESNKQSFGRWYSGTKRNAASKRKLMSESAPQNEIEALQHGNALANTGNYPVGTDECFNVGIAGGCGTECFVYQKGECPEPQEMVPRLESPEEKADYKLLYGATNEH